MFIRIYVYLYIFIYVYLYINMKFRKIYKIFKVDYSLFKE